MQRFFLENNDEFFNHFGLRFEIRSPTENLKMCYLDILKRRIRTMIIFSPLFQGTKDMHRSHAQANFASKAIFADFL